MDIKTGDIVKYEDISGLRYGIVESILRIESSSEEKFTGTRVYFLKSFDIGVKSEYVHEGYIKEVYSKTFTNIF